MSDDYSWPPYLSRPTNWQRDKWAHLAAIIERDGALDLEERISAVLAGDKECFFGHFYSAHRGFSVFGLLPEDRFWDHVELSIVCA